MTDVRDPFGRYLPKIRNLNVVTQVPMPGYLLIHFHGNGTKTSLSDNDVYNANYFKWTVVAVDRSFNAICSSV